MGNRWGRLFYILMVISTIGTNSAFGSRDYMGLFGSYRRDKYTENEGHDSDFGIDLSLSTMLPVSPVISSQQTVGGPITPLPSALFFNGEFSVFATLFYNWEIYGTVGYYTYDTRKQSASTGPTDTLPRYHQYEMDSIPIVAGVRYRFSRSDIVPYLGIGAGISRVHRKAYYDFTTTQGGSALQDEDYNTVLTGEITAGLEFFFASGAGIRLETSAYYLNLPSRSFTPNGGPTINTWMFYGANPWFVRYASGIFLLF
jgi:opacity protein-like surface antigen